jgi:hypothetical protein
VIHHALWPGMSISLQGVMNHTRTNFPRRMETHL